MPTHAFVDESSRGGYLLCAVVLLPSELAPARRILRTLCKPGQRRVHMKHESDGRRREILSVVSQLEVETRIYRARLDGRSERRTRDECFRVMVPELIEQLSVARMVVESCDQDRQDNQVIREMVMKTQAEERFSYLHSAPANEPLLWLPDIVAWAIGRGGDWKRRCGGDRVQIRDIEP
jgi:hypothetical protein